MFLGAVIFAIVWCLIALFLRRYPETMSGYNTMSKAKREKFDIHKIGRLISNAMFVGTPSVLLSPLMPNIDLYTLLLCWIPCGIVLVAGIYVNVRKDKFQKQ
ncbi:MAG: DUF3784 domain-containing protein [Alistipes sp.]|nr:DUF3784 domain-containing protein [Alistipes sp.]